MSRPVIPFALGYRPALDSVRAVAIIAVVGFHVAHAIYPDGRYPFSGGFIGVDLFFTLSGFLITAVLVREWDDQSRVRLKSFYLRRVRRLLPAQMLLLLMITVGVLAALVLTGSLGVVRDAALAVGAVLGNFANWVVAFGWWELGPLGPMWSLSIEEQFYFLWPVTLVILLRSGISRDVVAVGLVIGAAASAVWRAVVFADTGSVERAYYGLDTHADFLLLGCALAIWMSAHGEVAQKHRRILGVGAGAGGVVLVATLCLAEYGEPALFYGGYSIVALSALAVVVQAVHGLPAPLARVLQAPVLLWIGRVSYGMYLWHYLWLYLVSKSGLLVGLPAGQRVLLALALVCLGTTASAAFSWYFVERRFLVRGRPQRVPARRGRDRVTTGGGA